MQKLKNLIGAFIAGLIVIVFSTVAAQAAFTGEGQVIQPDGKILIWGNGNLVVSDVPLGMLARLNPDGSRDTSFTFCGCDFIRISSAVVQSDGKIVIAGTTQAGGSGFSFSVIARVNADGSADSSFPIYGNVNSVFGGYEVLRVLPDDKILALSFFNVGGSNGITLLGLTPNNTGSGGFSIGIGTGTSTLTGFGGHAVTTDGKLYFSKTPAPTGPVFNPIFRYSLAGVADSSWTSPTVAGGNLPGIWVMDLQSNGDLIVGGRFSSLNGIAVQNIARVTSAGVVDNTFIYNGPILGSAMKRIVVLPDGKILLMDGASTLRRLNTNGTIDTTYTPAIAPSPEFSVDAQGRIVFAGANNYYRLNTDGTVDTRFVPVFGPARTISDFDGDGRSDIGIFRPSNGTWFLQRSSSGEFIQAFGASGDKVAAADYDGDGKTDLAIYRNGAWWYINSGNGTLGLKDWGTASDVPMPSDFDADGKADFVYYRPSTGQWFRSSTATGATSTVQFGLANDVPVIADMDGDGKADPTIFRASTGTWWYRGSVNGADTPIPWGQSGDIPVTGDYDGDRKTDAAIFRPSDGLWYVLKSSGGYAATLWGVTGDRPVAADYDGDGKADVAVYRPSTGVWFIMQSTAGFTGLQYGFASDLAIQNAFVQ